MVNAFSMSGFLSTISVYIDSASVDLSSIST